MPVGLTGQPLDAARATLTVVAHERNMTPSRSAGHRSVFAATLRGSICRGLTVRMVEPRGESLVGVPDGLQRRPAPPRLLEAPRLPGRRQPEATCPSRR